MFLNFTKLTSFASSGYYVRGTPRLNNPYFFVRFKQERKDLRYKCYNFNSDI